MKKIIFTIFLFLIFVQVEAPRSLGGRRMNVVFLSENHAEKANLEAQILKELSDYDFEQAKLNSKRLFIRDKIILQ